MKRLEIVPCFWVFWTLNGLFVAYHMTITNGHTPTYLVYISETGSYYPECILFTVVFSVSAILGACTVYIMYRFMTLRTTDNQTRQGLCQSILLAIGLISCLGTVTVAVFQVITHPYIHRAGAAVAFGFGTIYNIIQSVKLYRTTFSSRRVCHIRMALSVLMATALIIFVACKIPLLLGLCGGEKCIQICDVSAVITEWLAFVTFMVHYLTYYTDFQHLCIQNTYQYEEREKKAIFLRYTDTLSV